MKDKKIFVFTHFDLDGAASYLITKWAHPGYKIEYMPLSGTDLRHEIIQWKLRHNFDDYEKVFFLDLDVSDQKDIIDYENVVIIDHHKSHVDNMKYEKAIPIVKEYSSAAFLAYKFFKKIYDTKFTKPQKMLMLYANDYDSYNLVLEDSKKLNAIFWNTQKSFDSFVKTYSRGFKPFTEQQEAIYNLYISDVSKLLDNIKVFKGHHADVDGIHRILVSTFADKHMNDVAEYLLEYYQADAAIIINLKSKNVHFRRPKDGTMRLNIFAKDYADGGGHEFSAGGRITDEFMEFTKTLKPL